MILRLLLTISLTFAQLSAVPSNTFASDNPKEGSPYFEIKSTNAHGESLEIKTVIPQSESDLRNAAEWASKELSRSDVSKQRVYLASEGQIAKQDVLEFGEELKTKLSTKSSLKSEVEFIEADVPTESVESTKEEISKIKELFHRHERITLTLLKAGMKGGVTAAALVVASGLPTHTIIPIALYSSLQSGFFQYHNATVDKFLDGNPEKKERILNSGRFGFLKFKTLQLSRSFMIGMVANTATTLAAALSGNPAGSLSYEAFNVLRASLLGTASRGLWSTAIASETRDGINANEGKPEVQAAIQRRSNIFKFSLSMINTAGGILTVLGIPTGFWMQGLMGVGGLIYTGKHWLKKRKEISARSRFLRPSCRQVFAL